MSSGPSRPAVLGLLAVAAWAGLAPPAAAQEPAAGSFADQVSVGYVLVPVTVRSRLGFVSDLAADDFSMTVDRRPVAIDSFERGASAPLRLAFLQDLSGSMGLGGRLEQSRRLVGCLLERARPGDQLALATFAGRQLQVEVPFTRDAAPLLESMAGWRPYGVTALHDAVARVPEIAPTREAPNAAVVLITDGVENASTLAPERAREIVRAARIPVYALGFTARGAEQRAASDLARYADVLRRLAAFTGGRYHAIHGPEDVEAACEQVFTELRERYVLGFATANSGVSAYRRLRVEVDRPGRLMIRHRLGYQGFPPQ